MSPMIVRLGGLLVFLSIAAGIAAIAVYLAVSTGWEAEIDPKVREGRYLSAIKTKSLMIQLGLTFVPAVMAAVFWTTWGFFRAVDHKSAKAPTLAIAILATLLTASQAIVQIFGDDFFAALFTVMLPIFAGFLFIPLLIWFSTAVILFGRDEDSSIWRAVGIVYLAGTIPAGAGLVWQAAGWPGWTTVAYPLIAIVGAMALGGWVCHGIALILGAGRMARARSAEAAAQPLGGPGESD